MGSPDVSPLHNISMDSYDCECEIDHASYKQFMEKGESTDRCPVCGDKLRSDRIKKNPRLRDAIQDAVRRQRGAYDYLPAAAAPSNLFARSRDGGLPTPEPSAPPAPPAIYFPSVIVVADTHSILNYSVR
eukprot:CAMPEP_0178707426 /NCGR_PEP_ID=MMETSP0699-20121125/16036_1 /TAXON_ID=265572 /ORGANISM="Extubocellulus spinifer, Strain CCMP396" /LENGTH=129 /DNA_ID=CAMNT_0020355497 /DNA_START=341 /DNA_END=730 /DNA_ORIENTATION=+